MHARIISTHLPTAPALLLAGVVFLLTACGNKGALTLPPRDAAPKQPQQKTAPAAPAAPAPTLPADKNSPVDNTSTSAPASQ